MTAAADARVPQLARDRHREPGGTALLLVALLVAIMLGLPVAVLVVRAVAVGALATAASSTAVLDALLLSLVTTAVSAGIFETSSNPFGTDEIPS